MTQERFKTQITAIRQQAKIVLAMAEAVDSTTSPTVHNLWKAAGKLDCMVTALREEMAGNEPPKSGG